MGATFHSADHTTLYREADRAAARLVRDFGLPASDREDLCHDLLVDLLARVDKFDPRRGTLGAFAGIIIQHRAARIAARLRRDRVRFATRSVDEPIVGGDGLTLLDTCTEDDGYLAWMGSTTSPITVLEDRLSMNRALNTLSPEHIGLCAELVAGSRCGEEGFSRATRYRNLHEVRLQLLAAGVGART